MGARERWRIDAERSTLRFHIQHAVLRELGGQFHCWGGMVLFDPDPVRCSVRVWVDLSSIDTGSMRRDNAILATELFDVIAEPALVFDSLRVEALDADCGVVVGWLALNSYRKQIAVKVERGPTRASPPGTVRLGFTARASIERRALGLHRHRHPRDWLSEQLVGDTIDIAASIELARDLTVGPTTRYDHAPTAPPQMMGPTLISFPTAGAQGDHPRPT
jgi:polyisoprenoid-binding protein YceI